jgi:hypothetical protein
LGKFHSTHHRSWAAHIALLLKSGVVAGPYEQTDIVYR